MPNTDPAIIFIHIPKTGGATLTRLLLQQYPPAQVFVFNYNFLAAVAQFSKKSQAELAEYRLFCGHLYFGLDRQLPMPCTYFTFLREPVERVMSQYYYEQTRTVDGFGRPQKPLQFSLLDFVRLPQHHEARNYQVRVLAGVRAVRGEPPVTRAMLETAMENLNTRFSMVGLTEEYDTSLLLLQRAFDWHLPSYTRRNVTKAKPSRSRIEPHVLEEIAEQNSLDSELYAFAHNLFREQCTAYGSALARDVERYRLRNSLYQRVLRPLEQARRRRFGGGSK
jgi:hypothetical protein